MKWEESLPLGNGRMGACIFGRCDTEIIRLNEETLWEGFYYDWNNPELKEHLPEIRSLIFAHEYSEAVNIAFQYFKCRGTGSRLCHPGEPFGTFRNAGDIVITDKNENSLIERRLDILHGVARTETENYRAVHFISDSANVLADSFTAKNGKLAFDIRYDHDGGGSDNDAGANANRVESFTGNDIVKELSHDFGGCAGIANMLLSDVDGIKLLPALPKQWKNGCFKNFRAKGNKVVSCVWRDGKIIESKIINI